MDAGATTAFILGTRYYERIGGHLLNVLSGVVMPLDKVDYYDSRGRRTARGFCPPRRSRRVKVPHPSDSPSRLP